MRDFFFKLFAEAQLSVIPKVQQHPEVPGLSSLAKLLVSRKRSTGRTIQRWEGAEKDFYWKLLKWLL